MKRFVLCPTIVKTFPFYHFICNGIILFTSTSVVVIFVASLHA